jgi:hypothetical protein
MRTNVFTCCNGVYNDFIPLFILSNLYHNDDVFVEIGTDDLEGVTNLKSIKELTELYPNRFKLRSVNFNHYKIGDTKFSISPNTVRFILNPEIKLKYVYISDVDIVCLTKNFTEQHIIYMDKEGLPYSNMVRAGKKILTGLHFTPYENHYPLTDFSDLLKVDSSLLGFDEKFLYQLVEKRYPTDFKNYDFRPVHGIHISLNREPYDGVNWGLSESRIEKWKIFRTSDEFSRVEPFFSNMIKEKINIIDNYKI